MRILTTFRPVKMMIDVWWMMYISRSYNRVGEIVSTGAVTEIQSKRLENYSVSLKFETLIRKKRTGFSRDSRNNIYKIRKEQESSVIIFKKRTGSWCKNSAKIGLSRFPPSAPTKGGKRLVRHCLAHRWLTSMETFWNALARENKRDDWN